MRKAFGVLVLTGVVVSMLPLAASAQFGRDVRFYPDPENGVLWVVGVLPEQPNGDIEIIYNGHPYTRLSKLQVTIPYLYPD